MTDANDIKLLRNYYLQGAEDAFAELVQRHVNLVYTAALRHVGNAAHAEEVTQVVFVILARKAGRLRPDIILESWLYETTRLTSLSFLRGERRRHLREQEAYMQSTLGEPNEDVIWKQMSPLLDEALSRLDKKDRVALILRFFKEKNLGEVAAAMNISKAAAQSRVHRAVEKLRQFFVKRGVVMSAAVMTGAISAHSVQSAPLTLINSVTAAGITKGTATSGSASTLIKGTLKLMAWSKAKTTIVASVLILAVAGTATIAVQKHSSKHVLRRVRLMSYPSNLDPNSTTMLTLGAVRFLQRTLVTSGGSLGLVRADLPSIVFGLHYHRDSRGNVIYEDTNVESFPFTHTFLAGKGPRGALVYHYTVVKNSATDEWQLKRAWKTSPKGVVVEEYPVP